MAAYYLDTSALVKHYAQEQGTLWMTALVAPQADHDLYTVRLTGPEMVAALARKARTGAVTPADAARAALLFRYDWQQRQYRVIEVVVAVADRAMALVERHGMRGYDAVHLATALEAQDVRQTLGLSAIIFVSADDEQRRAAAAEGLLVENPNAYP